MKAFACFLVCVLLSSPPIYAQEEAIIITDGPPPSLINLAAELARLASRLAGVAAHNGSAGARQHRRHKQAPAPASATPHRADAAVQNVNKGLVQSVPVDFKGHKLTVVALANE
jgi:hypothetical protein